jgi:peptide/nickel transport system permease protein
MIARYAARRIMAAIPVLIGAALVAFLLMRLVPGDPALALLGSEADPAAVATLRHELALDQPIASQFLAWMSQAAVGNLGRSIASGRMVLPMLASALGPTVLLAASAMGLAVLIGVPAGVYAATHRPRGRALTFMALLGMSMPSFWLGLILILTLAIWLPVFPASGYVPFAEDPLGHLAHLALPALTLAAAMTSITLRITQTAMLQALRAPHVRTALAKGLTVRQAVWGHAFLTARITVLVQLAVQAGKLLGGVVVIETVFAWPGLGKLAVDAVFARDYPVLQGAVLLIALSFVVLNLMADLAQVLLDPRVQTQ